MCYIFKQTQILYINQQDMQIFIPSRLLTVNVDLHSKLKQTGEIYIHH